MKYHPFGIRPEDEGKRSEFIKRATAPKTGFDYHFRRGKIQYHEIQDAQHGLLWRVIRAHAIAKYQLNAFEPLSNLDNPALWSVPMPDSSPADRSHLFEQLSDTWAGKALLPQAQDILPEYISALKRTKKLLGIKFKDTPIDDNIFYGLEDISNWPDSNTIQNFEHLRCLQIQSIYYSQGTNNTLQKLMKTEGFSKSEAEAILKLAKKVSTSSIEINDPDTDRRVMVSRLEHAIANAREQMDLRGELQALSTLAKVQGLDRDVQINPMTEFIDLIRSAGTKHDRLASPHQTWVQDDRALDAYLPSRSDGDSITIDIKRET